MSQPSLKSEATGQKIAILFFMISDSVRGSSGAGRISDEVIDYPGAAKQEGFNLRME